MRQLSVSVLAFFVISLSLATHGIEANLSFSLSRASSNAYNSNAYNTHAETSNEHNSNVYKRFMKKLRLKLTEGTDRVYDIPVLHQSVPASERFILFDLTNLFDETITFAMDVTNVNVVGYLTGTSSYFFPDAPRLAVTTLFSEAANRKILKFGSAYEYLEKTAEKTRQETPLGVTPLSDAIAHLFHYEDEYHQHQSLSASFMVIFQMISEAVRFKFIEQSVSYSLRYAIEFTPCPAILSLENNWSKLSELIQGSLTLEGIFGDFIELQNSKDQSFKVDSIYYQIILPNVALLLYRCHFSRSGGNVAEPSFIRMPLRGAELNSVPCQVLKRTISISGQDGLCANVEGARRFDGNRIILLPCGSQVNRKWTFQRDGTIQSLGKCMTTNTLENSIVLYNCSLAGAEATTWEISTEGTIINPSSGLVLTAEEARMNTALTVMANTYITGQSWRAGVNVNPIVSKIMGLNDTCLEATNGNTNIWLENCVNDKIEQQWTFYSDGTIRVNDDRSLCVTTSGFGQLDLIVIKPCIGSANQRWVFKGDNSILNPKSQMVLDVKEEDVDQRQIILHALHGGLNQQWLPLY